MYTNYSPHSFVQWPVVSFLIFFRLIGWIKTIFSSSISWNFRFGFLGVAVKHNPPPFAFGVIGFKSKPYFIRKDLHPVFVKPPHTIFLESLCLPHLLQIQGAGRAALHPSESDIPPQRSFSGRLLNPQEQSHLSSRKVLSMTSSFHPPQPGVRISSSPPHRILIDLFTQWHALHRHRLPIAFGRDWWLALASFGCLQVLHIWFLGRFKALHLGQFHSMEGRARLQPRRPFPPHISFL